MGPVGQGLGQTIVGLMVAAGIAVGLIVFGVTKLTKPKELIVNKRLVPEKRLVTDGKKVDTVFVYKLD